MSTIPLTEQSTFTHWIGGKSVINTPVIADDGSFPTESWLENISPVTARPVSRTALGSETHVDVAVSVATAAQVQWAYRSPVERGKVLIATAQILQSRQAEFVGWETKQTGKTQAMATGEFLAACDNLRYFGGILPSILGDVIPLGGESFSMKTYEPWGVVAVITPWNAPLGAAMRSIAAALAAGNSVVAKPSEHTSATTLLLGEVLQEAGLPDGVYNVVTGTGEKVGMPLVENPGTKMVTFTGSVGIGKHIAAVAAQRLIPVTLELGGKSPHIIFDDAPLETAAEDVVGALIRNAGQVCSAGTRILVQSGIARSLIHEISQRMDNLVQGVDYGPITTAGQYQQVRKYMQAAVDEQLEIVAQSPAPADNESQYVAPHIYQGDHGESVLEREEIFGPLGYLSIFTSADEAISQANATNFGLAAGIWTADINRAIHVARRLEAGQIYVNGWRNGEVSVPFGGYKDSGLGREKGLEGLLSFFQVKSIIVTGKEIE